MPPLSASLRRDLGAIESYATLLGMLIGAGIFKVTSDAWELTGSSVILGYLVLAPAILATSVAYSVFLSTPLGREPGGEYTHLSRTFGGYDGFVCFDEVTQDLPPDRRIGIQQPLHDVH